MNHEEKIWTTNEGENIEYKDLKDDHLLNILRWIKKRAEEGFMRQWGGGGWDIDDMWFDEEWMQGDDVLEFYDYDGLLEEAKKRKLL